MGMFKPDLFRAFLIGFLIGCAGLATTVIGSEAQASTHAQPAVVESGRVL